MSATRARRDRPGRPTRLDTEPQLHRIIVAALSRGHYPGHAADLAGVNRDTLTDWIGKGLAEHTDPTRANSVYAKFYRACQAAQAQWVDRQIQRVQDAGEKDWRASASILGRRHREWSEKPAESETGRNITIQIGIALPGTTSHALPSPSASAYLDVLPELLNESSKV